MSRRTFQNGKLQHRRDYECPGHDSLAPPWTNIRFRPRAPTIRGRPLRGNPTDERGTIHSPTMKSRQLIHVALRVLKAWTIGDILAGDDLRSLRANRAI